MLVNRTREGSLQVFDNLVFHRDPSAPPGAGVPLEMREFSEGDLKSILAKVGFTGMRVHGDSFERFGILWPEPWSLPIAARKGEYAMSREAAREIMEQWTKLREDLGRTEVELLLESEPVDVRADSRAGRGRRSGRATDEDGCRYECRRDCGD